VDQIVVAAVVALVVVAVAVVLRRRTRPDRPTQPRRPSVPAQLDRNDFERSDAPWLVVVFGSATCLSCSDTQAKAAHLASTTVAVADVDAAVHPDLHRRYGIDAVPVVVVADADGVVRASFVGPPSAADLWATMAELREPGSAPPECDHHGTGAG
jgi:hypothetical protein